MTTKESPQSEAQQQDEDTNKNFDFKKIIKEAQAELSKPYFKVQSFGECMEAGSKVKDRRKIFGVFCYEDTNTFLFSKTNYGKSIIGFIVAVSSATGSSFNKANCFINECEPKKTLLIDLENDEKEIYDRHSPLLNGSYRDLLNKNLSIVHERPEVPGAFDMELMQRIESLIKEQKPELVILDNLSKIMPDSTQGRDTTVIIDTLKRIKQNTGCSFFVIGHTTKGNTDVRIKDNDYYGSAAINNFFQEITHLDINTDGNFFLRHSKTKKKDVYRDIVPVMVRHDKTLYGLGFEFTALCNYNDIALPMMNTGTKSTRKVPLSDYSYYIKRIHTDLGMSKSDIAKMLDTSRQSIHKLF